jgi:hypothetical protein
MNRTAHVPFAALLPPPSPPPLPLPAAVSSCFSPSSMSQVFTGLTSVGHAWEQGWEGELAATRKGRGGGLTMSRQGEE